MPLLRERLYAFQISSLLPDFRFARRAPFALLCYYAEFSPIF